MNTPRVNSKKYENIIYTDYRVTIIIIIQFENKSRYSNNINMSRSEDNIILFTRCGGNFFNEIRHINSYTQEKTKPTRAICITRDRTTRNSGNSRNRRAS